MPPKKPQQKVTSLESLFALFKKIDGTTAYRFFMFLIILSVSPLAKFLPTFDGFTPLWTQVEQVVKTQQESQKQIEEVNKKVTTIEERVKNSNLAVNQ